MPTADMADMHNRPIDSEPTMRPPRRLCLLTLGAGLALGLPLGSTSHAFTSADGASTAPVSTQTTPAGTRGTAAAAVPAARLAQPASAPAVSRRDAGNVQVPAQKAAEAAKPAPRAGTEGSKR
jgi:hypothetical protein